MSRTLGLPSSIRACLFDLDGVLTQTAGLHAAAWKQMFDAFLRNRAEATGSSFEPFDAERDYHEYVDGKLRYDGVRSFLASRGIQLLEGEPDDPPGAQTIIGLGDWKNELVLSLIRGGGVETYPGSLRYVRAARDAGLRRAIVSASKNCREILLAAGIDDLFEEVIDGVVAEREHLSGKPAPDTFLAGAQALRVPPAETAVFEDALAGVEAARAGGFGFVVGVDRSDQAEALLEHGADVVVSDLAELLDGASISAVPPCRRYVSSSSRGVRTRADLSFRRHARTACGTPTTFARTCSPRRSSAPRRVPSQAGAPTLRGSSSTIFGTRSHR